MKCFQAIAALATLVLVLGSVTVVQAEAISYFEDFESVQAATDWAGVVDDDTGSNKVLRDSASMNQDIPGVNVGEGVIQASVDLLVSGIDGSEWRYVYFGETANNASSNAYFGIRNEKFTWKDGDGVGGTTTEHYGAATANNTWYTFVADIYLTGAKANTWDLKIYDASDNLLESATGLGFRTNGVAIDRVGFSFSGGGGDYMQVDNLSLQTVPEPTTFVLLACGGLLLAMATYRRRNS